MRAAKLLSERFLRDHPAEAAALIESRPAAEISSLIEGCERDVAAAVLRHMTPARAAGCLEQLPGAVAAEIGHELPASTLAAVLRRMPDPQREAVLRETPRRRAFVLRSALRHRQGTAGALMDPEVLALPRDITVADAVARLRREPQHSIYYLYVIDREQRLVGVLNLRELLLARHDKLVAEVMHSPVARLAARASRAEVRSHPGWGVYHALPVVDANGVFAGAIRYETLRDLESDAQPAGPGRLDPSALGLAELVWIALASVFAQLGGPPPARGPRRSSSE